MERDASLPPDYVDTSDKSLGFRLCVFARYVAVADLYGASGPELIEALEAQIMLMETEDASGMAAGEQLMLSAVALSHLVGDDTAAQLLTAYGAKPLKGEELWEA